MKPGRYAAADGSFGRSAGAAMGRGVALLAIALLIGVILLNKTDDRPPGSDVAAGPGPARSDDSGRNGTTTTTSTTTTLPAHQPKDVKVIVANASSVKGAAGRATDQLKPSGYNALAPANITTAVKDSAVYYVAGYDREAAAIGSALGLPASVVKPMPTPAPVDTKGANVLVVLGTDQAGRFAGATGAGGATTTAPAGATTTTTAKAAASTTTTTAKR
jgi:hypothetical protein